MKQDINGTQGSNLCLLEDYLRSSHVTLDLLEMIRGVLLRNNKFASVLISVDDQSVIRLTEKLLGPAESFDTNTRIEVCSIADWRTQICQYFAHEYDRNRFARSTEIETLCRKVIEHKQYSFIAHKSEGENNESVLKYDFSSLDPDARFILATQQEITHSLEHDTVTGGLNRAGLLRELQSKFELIKPSEPYSVLYFNIQNFRLINELHGDDIGDRVLQNMYTSLVYSDLHPLSYARIESDKFVCLVNNANLNMDVVCALCNQEYKESDICIPFRSQCGIYQVNTPDETAVNACNRAKLAIDYIKDSFLQPWMNFEPYMQKNYISDSEILKKLDDAIANHEFVPFFQPIVNTQTGRMEMAEALVRWMSPTKGMISPALFIPVLERHGGLSRIDRIMEQHIFDMQKMRFTQGLPIVPIDINLSWVDFADNELLDQLYAHIQDPSLPTDMMRYEITESALAEIAENRYDVLNFFKVQHVKLLVDDFGQAYSFGTMKDVDFTIIKIDKSMIDQIGSSRKVNLLIETMINMFHKMHAKVVAEGVETDLQVEYLKRVGCDYIQGFRFFRPMDEQAFSELLEHNEAAHAVALNESGATVIKADDLQSSSTVSSTRPSQRKKWWVFNTVFSLKDFKSTFYILGVISLLAFIIYASTYRLVYNLVTESCDELTVRDIDKIKLHIDLELGVAQEALQTFSTTVFQNGLNIPKSEEEIYRQMESFLSSSPFVSGIVAGFEDSVFPEYADRLGFGPLVRHQNDSLVRYQVGEIRDFRKTKEWYSECFAQKQARWSAPFFSEEGDIIIDYSIPLKNAEGDIIGVVACDLSISHLRQVTEDIKPYPTSIVMVMQEDLTFVIHPDRGYPMHKTLPVFFKEREIVADTTLLKALRLGENGKMVLSPKGEDLFLYYDVIDKAGYRLLIESSSSDVYNSLNEITLIMKLIGAGGLSLLILTLGFMIYDNKKRERRDVERNMEILRHTAETDGLTGLFNRSAGEKLISDMITKQQPGILAILDCDKFKQVNDNYGHATGDILLKKLSETLKTCFEDDVTLRLGGDEFALFCPGEVSVTSFQAKVQYFFIKVKEIRIEAMGEYAPSVSMGAALYRGEQGLDFDRLYTMADRLLYESKKIDGCALTITDN